MPLKDRRKSARHTIRPSLDALENRVVLSTAPLITVAGQTLTIEGSDGPDRIAVYAARHPGAVRVVVDGSVRVYEGIGDLVIRGSAGDDTIRIGAGVSLPARVEGGAGNDRIQGGSGAGSLLGGEGDDVVIGGGGRAVLDGGSGRNNVVIPKALGTIQVGRAASGDALRILRLGYKLTPLKSGGAINTGPIVVGPADLDDARIVAKLRSSYQAGQTVSMTNATPADAERLRSLLWHATPAEWDSGLAELVSFRKDSLEGGRSQSETTVVQPRQASGRVETLAARRKADQRVLERLTAVFAATPNVATPPSDPNNLLNLATSYLSRAIGTSTNGDEVQVVNTVYAARSFQNQADFYYVLQETDYHANLNAIYLNYGDATTKLTLPAALPTILQPSPQSTMSTTSVTSGVSYTIGGSIGFNESQGFNASISASVTVSNSTTTTYPPIRLINAANLATGVLEWGYNVTDASQAADSTLTFYNQWIWQVPFTAYAPGQTSIQLTTASNLYETNEVPISPAASATLTSTVPTPFGDVYALQKPVITALSSSLVREGQSFTITGSGLYPSLVTGVLIGGESIPAANYRVVSDTEITVVAPNSSGIEEPVVIQTTQGVSNDDVTITVYP